MGLDVLVRADAFVRSKWHDPYARIAEADELIEELFDEAKVLREENERLHEQLVKLRVESKGW